MSQPQINDLLFYIVVFTSFIVFGIQLVAGVQRYRTWGWLFVSLGILGISGLTFWIFPKWAGFISFPFWFIFIFMPFLGNILIRVFHSKERYEQAIKLYRIIGYLHPFDDWLEAADINRATRLAQQGNIEEASQIINFIEQKKPRALALYNAKLYLYRQKFQWEELINWFEYTSKKDKILIRNTNLFAFYIRALGEIGELDRMVSCFYENRRWVRGANPSYAKHLYLVFFAFCGESKQAELLLKGRLKSYNPALQKFWLATAKLAGGRIDEGLQEVSELLQNPDWNIQRAAQNRLAHPPIFAAYLLSLQSKKYLDDLIRQRNHTNAYKNLLKPFVTKPYLTAILIALNFLLFVFEIKMGTGQDYPTLYKLGVLVMPDVITSGEWWRLISNQFLHYGAYHLASNMLNLVLIGPIVEYILGKWRYLLVYMVSGTGACLVIVLLTEAGLQPRAFGLGASGAIMGVTGALIAIFLRSWWNEGAKIARNLLILLLFLEFAIITWGVMSLPEDSNIVHIVGLILGFLIAIRLKHRTLKSDKFLPNSETVIN